ncbi:sarcosine oxidase subunit gamma [Xanthobacter oligotrophicus]|uniref:sarcosine oxidase subunit gamma n=1 Tax=Xanthobacter oligotrophicus TaxID=2607286 RepID=UPI00165D4301|nr:sarcosine oxidase subunit gamma family protein [Xanthobacter oligotrophicus]MCG5234222.1 sarcosine oxidase subunit gamma [Xanthobacter oligotrophicus]
MSDLLEHIAPTRLVPEGHYGPEGSAGVTARAVETLAAATLVARKGATARLIVACAAAGLPLADAPRASTGAGLEAVGTGPGRWLVLAEGMSGADLVARLAAMVPGLAAITDQSDANLILDISGEKGRAALAKGVTVDLDPTAFAEGHAMTTAVSHVGVTFWQRDGATFRFAVGRSFAPAFLRWLTVSSAEYGFTLSGTGRG